MQITDRLTLLNGDCLAVMRDMPDASVDAVVCDPPYGLSAEPDMAEVMRHWMAGDDYVHTAQGGFMGRTWDSFVPGPSVWREALRVLKPGGHLAAFFGTRTYDIGTLAIRLAGFEVRDQLAWVYGSGFPKSLDVSKAIDKQDAVEMRLNRRYLFTSWFVTACSLTAREMDAVCETNTMGRHWTDVLPNGKQPDVPTRQYFEMLRPFITDVVPPWVEEMVDERTVESENFKAREVTGVQKNAMAGWNMDGTTKFADRDITAPATPEAARWAGWGTALKPAWEPVCLARKPLIGTVASNVLAHGTGGINIDGCRVHSHDSQGYAYTVQRMAPGADQNATGKTHMDGVAYKGETKDGRFPANLIHDGSDEVLAGFPVTTSGGGPKPGTARTQVNTYGDPTVSMSESYGSNTGSAARFFYCAKASRSDRQEGNDHPTVKPTALMEWLARLVTPPGGLVLDPFMGSGSTGKACHNEGFRFVGVERDPDYYAMAVARIWDHVST